MPVQFAASSDPHREFEVFCQELILEQIRMAFESVSEVVRRDLPDALELDLAAAILGQLLGTGVLRRPYDFGKQLVSVRESVAVERSDTSGDSPHTASAAIDRSGLQQKPNVGSIVLFTERADCPPIAAIVTAVDDSTNEGKVFLHAFPVTSGVGVAWSHIPFSVVPRPGYWSWAVRV